MGHIIDDADGELILGLRRVKIIENGLDHRRREILRSEAISAPDDNRIILKRGLPLAHRFSNGRSYIQI